MSKKMELVLHYPSSNRQERRMWKGTSDGAYAPPNHSMSVQLHPGMAVYDKTKKRFVAYIDAEKWLQMRADGVQGWIGPDPRLEMAERIKKIRQALQTRGIKWEKFLWPAVIFILGVMAALIASPVLIMGQK